jgi:hypothetical protein
MRQGIRGRRVERMYIGEDQRRRVELLKEGIRGMG